MGIGWRSTDALKISEQQLNRFVSLVVNIGTANDAKPRETVSEVARLTKPGASNVQLGRNGVRGIKLLLLMAGFPALQRHVNDILARFPTEPDIVEQKLKELEATWRSLRKGE